MTQMTDEQKDQVAQAHFGKPFEQCSTAEKRSVGGYFRAGELGPEGYREMGKHGHGGGGHGSDTKHEQQHEQQQQEHATAAQPAKVMNAGITSGAGAAERVCEGEETLHKHQQAAGKESATAGTAAAHGHGGRRGGKAAEHAGTEHAGTEHAGTEQQEQHQQQQHHYNTRHAGGH